MEWFNEYGNLSSGEMMFSQTAVSDMEELTKAIAAGDITGQGTLNNLGASGAPLKVESLDSTLKVITFKQTNINLWRNIPKEKAYNTVEEFNQLVDYGQDRGGFNREGELPEEEDSIYVRRSELVKFLGITKSVTHPMTLVRTSGVGQIVTKEVENGTLWIMRKINKALAYGDSSIIGEEFNGLYRQHFTGGGYLTLEDYFNSEVVIDLRGNILREKDIEDAANSIVENYGLATVMYAPPKVLSDFVTNFYGNKFIQPNSSALTDGIMGQKVKSFESQFGNIDLQWDVFLNPDPNRRLSSAATSTKSALPVTAGTATPIGIDSLSKFSSTDAGNYFYAVSAVNRYGESTLTLINPAATAVIAGGAVDLTFTPNPSPYSATGFRVYRSARNASNSATAEFYPIFTVGLPLFTAGYDGGGANTIRDRNRFLTNTNQAFLIQGNNEVFEFKQLAPLMKMDLAQLSPSYRFMVLLYGTPQLFAPKKMVRFINVGKL